MKWYQPIFNKNPERDMKNKKGKLPNNIYNTKTIQEHYTKFNLFHYVFKYKFLLPLILLSNKILGKYMIKKIDTKSHNTNLRIFNKSYEKAIEKWYLYYLRNNGPIETRKTKSEAILWSKQHEPPAEYLRILKEIILTGAFYDTAYREFFNVLMHEIALGMVKEYSRSGKYSNKTTNHLLFTTDIYEVNYYVLEKQLRYSMHLNAVNAKDLLEK